MAQIRVSDLTFSYEGSADNVLENVTFHIDTDWKLGLIGRNGKGKTTLLNLLMGKYEFRGSMTASTKFDYFPYIVRDTELQKTAAELIEVWKPQAEAWQVLVQMNQIRMDPELLYRPFATLSHGERTRVMLAVLFSAENEFLLIDEPTNHLDQKAREIVKEYLSAKKGFILVSHDRDLLDAVCDHVLVLNRKTLEVQAGNFSSWWANKEKSDAFARAENEKHRREIGKLKAAADRSSRWADKNEGTKIGFDPVKEHDRNISSRAYIGEKTRKMQARVKSYEKRIDREIEEKEGLLQDIESVPDLRLQPLRFHKEVLVEARDLSLRYGNAGCGETDSEVRDGNTGRGDADADDRNGNTGRGDADADVRDENAGHRQENPGRELFRGLTFQIKRGGRIVLSGENGSGKSSIIKAVLRKISPGPLQYDYSRRMESGLPEEAYAEAADGGSELIVSGTLEAARGMTVSCVSQDTSFLKGSLQDYCEALSLDRSLFLAVLRQLGFGREQFVKNMEDYSEGQKKKVLIAASLITPAHLYIWDEPLNYIDVFSRMQIEKLILDSQPTMLLVEHDVQFQRKIATETIELQKNMERATG